MDNTDSSDKFDLTSLTQKGDSDPGAEGCKPVQPSCPVHTRNARLNHPGLNRTPGLAPPRASPGSPGSPAAAAAAAATTAAAAARRRVTAATRSAAAPQRRAPRLNTPPPLRRTPPPSACERARVRG